MEAFFNHLNPAVIKSIILKMNNQEIHQTMDFVKNKVPELPIGTKRSMYIRLHQFCISTLDKRQKQKSLF